MNGESLKTISETIKTWQRERWDRSNPEALLEYILALAEEELDIPESVVTLKDIEEFIERDARVELCGSPNQGTVYWYPGAVAAGQYALVIRESAFASVEEEELRYSTLSRVLSAYNYGPENVAPEKRKYNIHEEHCCIDCGCQYEDYATECTVIKHGLCCSENQLPS